MRVHLPAFIAAVHLVTPALATAETVAPSFDCQRAESSAETAICADPALARLDRRLADRFAAALAAAQGLDAGAAEAERNLRATQRGWIKGRDECWKAEDLSACVESAYLTRENELVGRWLLEEPASVVSYTCADNPANEVTAYFFQTELPAVRLEYGDSVDVGSLVPSGSGSKYAAGFGRSFWIRGEEATLVWPEGNEMACVPA